MDKNNYISITNLFKTYKYFQHHLIIKNVFTPSICEWVYSYNQIELNPFLLFSVPHILELVNKNYNINFHVNYEVQDIKIINNKIHTLYSSFLQKSGFKLVIPLSNCSITFDNELIIEVNCGEIMVVTSDRGYTIDSDVNIISIDITGSFDVYDIPNENTSGDTWWFRYLPTTDSECLRYIQTDVDVNNNNLPESITATTTNNRSSNKNDKLITLGLGKTQSISQNEYPHLNTVHKLSNIASNISMVNEYIYIASTDLDVDLIKSSCLKLNQFVIKKFEGSDPNFNLTKSIPTRIYSEYNLLMYPFPGFHSVYKKIQEIFYICYRNRNKCYDVPPHFIQCWLNVVYKDDELDWHNHWGPECNSWHGYIYIDAEMSGPSTLYKVPDYKEIVTIEGKNGNMIISPSNGDTHKTVRWTNENPRISIAFDILPTSSSGLIDCDDINHWVPI